MAAHELKVVFGEESKIDVEYKGFVIRTDQPVRDGGGGTAPSPFDYFLASIAACSGYFALEFCRARQIPAAGLAVVMRTERGEVSKMTEKVTIEVGLPAGFPEKYRAAIVKAIDHCTVKAHIFRPPRFDIVARPGVG